MLSTIALTVNGQALTGNSIQVASSLVEEITCTFTFQGTDWSGFSEIRAIFQNVQSGIKIEKTLSNQNSTTVPYEVLNRKGDVVVNLCAYSENAQHIMTVRMTSYKTKIIDVKQKVNTYGDNMLPPSRQYWQEELDAERAERQSADTTLQGNIDAEATARQAADATLQSNITAEATARQTADATLQGNINAEATSRQSADATLQGNINAEATARANADSTLQYNLDTEISDRENAEAILSGRISAIEASESTWNAKLDEAPNDGKTYGRKNKNWVEVEGGGGTGEDVNAVHYTQDTGKTAQQRAQARTNIKAGTISGTQSASVGSASLDADLLDGHDGTYYYTLKPYDSSATPEDGVLYYTLVN